MTPAVPATPGRYRPGAALAGLVRLRHPTCCAPGCPRAATRADLDHVLRYPAGPTCLDNLRPLCRRHHRMKHETAWSYRVLPSGAVRWTTPTGSQHDVGIEPLLPHAEVAPVTRAGSEGDAVGTAAVGALSVSAPSVSTTWADTHDTARLAATLRRGRHAPGSSDRTPHEGRTIDALPPF